MHTPLFIIERTVASNITAKASHESLFNKLKNKYFINSLAK